MIRQAEIPDLARMGQAAGEFYAPLHLVRTFDYELVKRVATHPRLFPHSTDDASSSAAAWMPLADERVWYLWASDHAGPIGIFMGVPETSCCFSSHVAILPEAWGFRGTLAAQSAIAWIFAHSPCRRIVAHVPSHNKLAIAFTKRCGLREFGTNEKSIMINGKLIDQKMFGINKEEVI